MRRGGLAMLFLVVSMVSADSLSFEDDTVQAGYDVNHPYASATLLRNFGPDTAVIDSITVRFVVQPILLQDTFELYFVVHSPDTLSEPSYCLTLTHGEGDGVFAPENYPLEGQRPLSVSPGRSIQIHSLDIGQCLDCPTGRDYYEGFAAVLEFAGQHGERPQVVLLDPPLSEHGPNRARRRFSMSYTGNRSARFWDCLGRAHSVLDESAAGVFVNRIGTNACQMTVNMEGP
jgi:hypothetical protein